MCAAWAGPHYKDTNKETHKGVVGPLQGRYEVLQNHLPIAFQQHATGAMQVSLLPLLKKAGASSKGSKSDASIIQHVLTHRKGLILHVFNKA